MLKGRISKWTSVKGEWNRGIEIPLNTLPRILMILQIAAFTSFNWNIIIRCDFHTTSTFKRKLLLLNFYSFPSLKSLYHSLFYYFCTCWLVAFVFFLFSFLHLLIFIFIYFVTKHIFCYFYILNYFGGLHVRFSGISKFIFLFSVLSFY